MVVEAEEVDEMAVVAVLAVAPVVEAFCRLSALADEPGVGNTGTVGGVVSCCDILKKEGFV